MKFIKTYPSASATRPGAAVGTATRKYAIMLAMGLTASIASAVLAAVDTPTGREGRVSNSFVTVEGEGVGVLDDGSISYDEGATGDIIVTARPGWRVNGQKSVTLNPARGSRQPLGATSDLHEDQEHIHFFPRSESDEHVPDSHMEIFAEANPASVITMYALPDTSTVVTVSANVYLMRSALHRKVAKYGKCWCGQARDPEIEYGLPYAVKPDRYEWTASGAGLTFHDSTWTGEMSKGLAQKIEFTVKAKRSSCTECDCEAKAEATVDVHELSIERPDYVGLDMTDAKRGEYVYKSATAKIDPAPVKAEYEWQKCGRCEFYGATNKEGVTYRANDETGPSGSYLEEELVVKATARNKDGLCAEASCTTNFTVVAVDVTINGVGEDKEEAEGAFIPFVRDETNGVISVDGTNKMVSVSFMCEPLLPTNEMVTVSCAGPAELYEELATGELVKITVTNYPAYEIASHVFKLHGHDVSGSCRDGIIQIGHQSSEALDIAKYTDFDIRLVTPAGDPVAEPVDSGDGQNEFTYSSSSPGVLTMNLKARVSPGDFAARIKDDCKFTVGSIGDSKMEWDAANPGGVPTLRGGNLAATVTFTGLPKANADFGRKTAAISFGGAECDANDYEVFFPKFAKNHPMIKKEWSANWFYYWKDGNVCGIPEDSQYDGVAMEISIDGEDALPIQLGDEYTLANKSLTFTSQIPGFGSVVAGGAGKGIQNVAEVVQHELHHRYLGEKFGQICRENPEADEDKDGIPSQNEPTEDGISTSPRNPDTYGVYNEIPLEAVGYSSYGDEEIRCRKIEMELLIEIFPGKDWANPGCQSKDQWGPTAK